MNITRVSARTTRSNTDSPDTPLNVSSKKKRLDLQCKTCSRCFSKPEHLTRHERIHSGSKPFPCPHADCEKQFSRQDSLARHVKQHTGRAREQQTFSSPSATFSHVGSTPMVENSVIGTGNNQQQDFFFPTPPAGGVPNDIFVNQEQADQSLWPQSEDIFALLTSEPNDWNVDPHLPFLGIPFLDQGDGSADTNQPAGSSGRARQAMHHLSSLVQDLSITLSQEVESTGVTAEFLDVCLGTFFSRFTSVFPILHQPTFSIKDCAPPVLLNILALGSLFVASEGARAKGEALWRLAHTAVATSWQSMLDQSDADDQNRGKHLVLTALLGQAYAVLSSNRSIRLTSHVFHGLGFYWARQSGIAPEATQMSTDWPTAAPLVEDKVARWKAWAAREVHHRALLGHYILDGLIAQSSGFPNSARHTANNMPLPCSDPMFEASTADEWAILHEREAATSVQPCRTFRQLLSVLFERDVSFNVEVLPHMAIPVLLEAIQSVISESHEAGGKAVGVPDIEVIAQTLWKLYDRQILHAQRPIWAIMDLSIRWHIVCISIIVEPGVLVRNLCKKFGVQQDLYGTASSGHEARIPTDEWKESPDARVVLLHAVSVLDLAQQQSLGKAQALHIPLALLMATTVLIATRTARSSKLILPDPICWRTVCRFGSLSSSEPTWSEGTSAATATFLQTGKVPDGSSSSTRNVLRDINTLQMVLQSLAPTWGVAKKMCELLQRLDRASRHGM